MTIQGGLQSVAQLFGRLVSTPGQAPAASPAYDRTVQARLSSSFAKERIVTPKSTRANFREALTAILARQQSPEEHLPRELGLVVADTYDSVTMRRNAKPWKFTRDNPYLPSYQDACCKGFSWMRMPIVYEIQRCHAL